MKKSTFILPLIFLFQISFSTAQNKITNRLLEVLDLAEENASIQAIIILEDQYPILDLDKQLYVNKISLQERAYTVIMELQQHAENSQQEILSFLNSKSIDNVISYKSFWISNVISIEVTKDILIELSHRQDISLIDLDESDDLIEPVEIKPASKGYGSAENNLKVVNANKMWTAGFTGAGVVVANLDTGVDGDHPALITNWHGNNVPWEYAWFDAWEGTIFPSDPEGSQDQAGHGTGTMGVMVGLDPITHDTVGMAFNAEWIACRSLFGTGNFSQKIECMEWIIDPDGDPSTIDDMPTVFNNSWGHYSYGCTTPYDEAITAVEAAGIAIVWAAGNNGPAPSSIAQPANQNHSEMYAFSVGGIDHVDPELAIFLWSSRGPSPCNLGTGNNIKPEISAPIYCRTSFLNFEYATLVGTSFSAPHVSGAIALLKEAFPNKTGTELKWMLYGSAFDRGIPGEDNSYGMGVLDVWAAYLFQPSPEDPRRPLNVFLYSDFTTPTSVVLEWIDPGILINGNVLEDFEIQIKRNGQLISSIAGGVEFYQDTALTDGMEYEYHITTIDINTDSLSIPVQVTVCAGGSPYPAAPTDLSCNYSDNGVQISWNDPEFQSDGTPIDDLQKIYIFRDDLLLDSVFSGVEDYLDFPPSGTVAQYYLIAVDNEIPANQSDPCEPVSCFIGSYPDVLVWVGPDTKFESRNSGDSIFNLLSEIKVPSFLSGDLFEFGPDLDSLDAIFAVLGCFPWPHIISQSSPEAAALESYLFNGGKLYLEGGHAFSPDPGWWPNFYDIHPWFGLSGSSIGSGDVYGVHGQSDFSNISFDYVGHNEYMNELIPSSATVILKNSQNEDVIGVSFDGAESGKSIGVVPSFGGLLDNDSITKKHLLYKYLDFFEVEYDTILTSRKNQLESTFDNIFNLKVSPNPINFSTSIEFSLPDAGFVLLSVFDQFGNKVQPIINEDLPMGNHNVSWNAEGLPPGIYFLRLEANGISETRKLILLK